MDPNVIATLIGSLGFPIVACCFMGYFVTKVLRELQDTISKNTDALQEVLTWIKALESMRKAENGQ